MRKQLALIAVFTLSVTSIIYAQSDTPTPADPSKGVQAQDEMYENDKAGGMLTNEKFVKQAATGGLAEVAASRLALDRSKDPKVRQFAERMVTEHTAANKELQAIASAKQIEVPEKPNLAQTAKLSLLKTRSGASFDKAYSEQMIKDHDNTVALFEQAADSTALDPQLRSFASKTLTVLRDHQKNAHGTLGTQNMSRSN